MADLNLDALRAEAGLEDHKLTVGGRTFTLPAILPMGVMTANSPDEALAALFLSDADPEQFTDDDIDTLKHLKKHLSMVRSDRPADDFNPDDPQTDVDFICERLYGIRRNTPNREARRSGQNGQGKVKVKK
jgi:hypothetical protein